MITVLTVAFFDSLELTAIKSLPQKEEEEEERG